MTTFRKEPIAKPKAPAQMAKTRSGVKRSCPVRWPGASRPVPSAMFQSDDLAELEDRQVDGNDDAADDDAEHDHDDGLDQACQRVDRLVDLALVVIGHLGQHR